MVFSSAISIQEFTKPYIEAFFADLDSLGIERAEYYPAATEHIPEMVEIVQQLVERGHAYYCHCSSERLEKMRAFGLNTVETYVAWNLHEPRPAEFNFDGMLDLVKFIETAAELGLKVIVRPGPYICSEWEFCGLPSWLLKDPNVQVRCAYPAFLEAVGRYFDGLLPPLIPLQSTHGGPIIAMQVENEYGSYGNDKAYLNHLKDGMAGRAGSTRR